LAHAGADTLDADTEIEFIASALMRRKMAPHPERRPRRAAVVELEVRRAVIDCHSDPRSSV
jgi:hypothetical protein